MSLTSFVRATISYLPASAFTSSRIAKVSLKSFIALFALLCAFDGGVSLTGGDSIGVVFAQEAAGSAAAAAPAAASSASGVFGPAPTQPTGQPSFLGSLMELLPVLVVCYFIFYFMVVKPQDSSAKAHKALIESLTKGDEVITAGGMIGKVAGTEEGHVLVEIASGVKVKFETTSIKKRVGEDQKGKAKAKAA